MVRQQQPPLCATANYGVEWYGASTAGGGRGAGVAARSGASVAGLSDDRSQSIATPKATHQPSSTSVESWRREFTGQPRSGAPGGVSGCSSGELEERMLRSCMSGDKDQWRTLLPLAASGGFQVNWQDKSGRTALSYAASSGHAEAVGKLLQCRGVDVNLGDNDGNTPLIYAAAMGFDGALSVLLSYPLVNVDQVNSNGCTALIKAAMSGHPSTVKMLLDAGASTSVRDRRRQLTPVEWARFCGSSTSYHLLRSCITRGSRDADCDAGCLGVAPRRRGATRRSGSTRVSLLRHRSASADAARSPSPSSSPTTPSCGSQRGGRCKERSSGGADALASFARRLRETLLFRSVSGRGQRVSSQQDQEQRQQQPERRLCVAAAFGQCASAPSIPLLLATPGGRGDVTSSSSPPARGDYEPCSAQAELVKWTLRQLGCDRPFRMHILKASVPRIEITAAADDAAAAAAAAAAAVGGGSCTEAVYSNGAYGACRRGGPHSPPPPTPPEGAWRDRRRSSDPVPWRCAARRTDGSKAGVGGASDGRADSGARGPPRRYASSPVNQMRQATASCR